MTTWIFSLINHFGYAAVSFLIAIENIFPPIPSEVILAFSGFLSSKTSLNIWGLIIASTIGATIGATILYWIGTLLNQKRLEALFIHPVFKKLGFKKDDIKKSINWFEMYGTKTILLGRCVPIIRSLISIPAGIAHVNIYKFLISTCLGSLIWNTVLISLGAYMGSQWEQVVLIVEEYSLLIIILTLGILLYFASLWYKKRLSKNECEDNE